MAHALLAKTLIYATDILYGPMHVQMQKAILKVIADRGIKKCKEMFDEIVEVILGK
jgi:hypothetical protein